MSNLLDEIMKYENYSDANHYQSTWNGLEYCLEKGLKEFSYQENNGTT